jgi:hypothetical protein
VAAVVDVKTDSDPSTRDLVSLAFRNTRGYTKVRVVRIVLPVWANVAVWLRRSGSALTHCVRRRPLFPGPFGCARRRSHTFAAPKYSIFGLRARIGRCQRPPNPVSYLMVVGLATRAMVGVRKVAVQSLQRSYTTHAHCVTASGLHDAR